MTEHEKEVQEELHGWPVRWLPSYPDVMIVECPCGHTSVRDRDEIPGHVCPNCGRGAK